MSTITFRVTLRPAQSAEAANAARRPCGGAKAADAAARRLRAHNAMPTGR